MTCGLKDGKPHIYGPLKAMRLKCLDCCCGSFQEVELCVVTDCSLYPYRFGKSPRKRNRIYTVEQKAEIGVRLKKARQIKSNPK